MADDEALRRFVAKNFPPGTDIYSLEVLKHLSAELERLKGDYQK